MTSLVVRGARQHNLRGFTLALPHGRLIVLTGPSGSGKSSLAFDTIYAEGQRRYIESLSTYAKQFLERMPRPAVDAIEGIAPAVAIEQKNPTTSSRSTVGTATEIFDYLRLLWSRVGRARCVQCGGEVRSHTVQEAVDRLADVGGPVLVCFPLPPVVRASHAEVVAGLLAMGFVRALVGDQSEARGHGGTEARGHGGHEVILSRTLRTTGISESALADRVGDPARITGEHLTLAWLPSPEGTDLRLTAWGLSAEAAQTALARAAGALRPLLGAHCYGEGDADLAALVLAELERRQARLAVAESCTGGLIGGRLTAVPGSSRVFVGGVVAYANDVKLDLLGVSADVLGTHGAVSEEVAREMAAGAGRVLAAEAAVAVTGIAGPDGGTPEKPVGTVWIAALWRGKVRAFHYVFPGEREVVRRRAAQTALDALRRALAGTP